MPPPHVGQRRSPLKSRATRNFGFVAEGVRRLTDLAARDVNGDTGIIQLPPRGMVVRRTAEQRIGGLGDYDIERLCLGCAHHCQEARAVDAKSA